MNTNKNNHYHNLDHSSVLMELGSIAYQKNIPLFTTLELSQDCNFRCGHCYNFDRTKSERSIDKNAVPLSFENWIKIIDHVMDEGAFYICLTGGEVFLYPRIWELIEKIHSRNGIVKLKTNGSLLTEENVAKLKRYDVQSLEISIYGMSEDSYQKFSLKNGMFQKVISGVERLKNLEISVSLNFILSRHNVHDLDQMVKFAQDLNFSFNFSDEITKRYDQTSSSLELNITEDQYKELLSGPYSQYFMIKHDLKDHSFQCACARNVCGVGFNGDVYPCIGAPIVVGNMMSSSFHELWTDADLFKKIRGIKNDQFVDCVKCDVAQYCNRSSGSAFTNTNDYFGCDPISLKMARIRKNHVLESIS